jgi:hypothetical protein
MSATSIARLQRAEREVQRWSRDEKRHWRSLGTPASARWYGARCAWGDALTLVQNRAL